MDYQHFLHAFLKHTQNSLECLKQNMIRLANLSFHIGADISNLL